MKKLNETDVFKNGYYLTDQKNVGGSNGIMRTIQPDKINDSNNSIIWGVFHFEKPFVISFDELRPIKLNVKWLSKFGFNQLDNGLFKKNDLTYNIKTQDLYKENVKGYRFGRDEVVYVHKFQMAYCLIKGEELI